jgi:hypothetical protein
MHGDANGALIGSKCREQLTTSIRGGSVSDTACLDRLVAAAFLMFGCSSGPASRMNVVPSLRPVDASRAMVVFGQIKGSACGNDAVAGALRDLKRLTHVDGYLEVVIEETGEREGRCASVTAYPFRYGTSTDLPGIRAAEESAAPELVPGRPAGDAPPSVESDCATACTAFSRLVESGSINQALARDRCHQRCAKPDVLFYQWSLARA